MWFDEIEQEFQRMSDRFFNLDDSFENQYAANRSYFGSPYYYGYAVTTGPDGKPVVKEHGNVKPRSTSEIKTPFVDEVLDKENHLLKLVAEMPGVEKSDINVSVEDKSVVIKAENGNRKFNTRVPIKYKIDENSAKARYTNGILELTFHLAEEKPKGQVINVE